MKFTAQQIAQLLEGDIVGDENSTVSTLSKIEEGTPGSLSFLANPQYTPHIYTTQASIVIVAKDFTPEKDITSTLIKVGDPYASFSKLLELYDQFRHQKTGIHPSAVIHESATIGEETYIGAHVVIDENVKIGNGTKIYAGVCISPDVKIGENCIINARVSIYHGCELGNNVTLHSGVIIGSDGFGFAPSNSGYSKVPQIGNVVVEDGVEIGANTVIDRATLGSTIIRKGVKLDNLIQIAHNVEVGENTVIAAQTGVAGSTKIGKNCMIGGQVGIIGHLKIGNGVKIAAQSGIGHDLEDNSIVQGSPAIRARDYKRAFVHFTKLPDIVDRIKTLEKES